MSHTIPGPQCQACCRQVWTFISIFSRWSLLLEGISRKIPQCTFTWRHFNLYSRSLAMAWRCNWIAIGAPGACDWDRVSISMRRTTPSSSHFHLDQHEIIQMPISQNDRASWASKWSLNFSTSAILTSSHRLGRLDQLGTPECPAEHREEFFHFIFYWRAERHSTESCLRRCRCWVVWA